MGTVVAGFIIFVVEWAGSLAYAPPPGADLSDPEVLREVAENLPWLAFAFEMMGWAVGTVTGAYAAARLAGSQGVISALVVGGLMLAIGVVMMLGVPQPFWVWLGAIVIFPGTAYLGGKLAATPLASA